MGASLAAVDGIATVDIPTLREFYAMALSLGVNPDWLSAVISFESGWNPKQRNLAGSGATGLIQFMPGTAKWLGTTTDALAKMSVKEQLPYVYKYFAGLGCSGKMNSLADVYAGVFGPGPNCKNTALPDDAPIYKDGSAEYAANKALDKPYKGYISKSDLARVAQAKLDKAANKPRIDLGDIPAWSGPPSTSGCRTDKDCPSGYVCQNGECIRQLAPVDITGGCGTNADCFPDEVCVNGKCVKAKKAPVAYASSGPSPFLLGVGIAAAAWLAWKAMSEKKR